jgi:nucleoside-diphosphate-sugar epimerase/GNAT superfamily N-acetyltransferase
MIKRLNNKDPEITHKMRTVFQASYAIEAKILQADDFPPLKRTLEEYKNTDTLFYGFWQMLNLAAVIEIKHLESSIHIQSLVVDPGYFRQGIAAQLLDYVLINNSTPLFTVETGSANAPAIKLYEKLGFKEVRHYLAGQGIKKICLEKHQSISLLGCGWLGLPLAQQLVGKNFVVKGTTTTKEKLSKLEQAKISAYILDLSDLDAIDQNFLESNILIIATPSKHYEGFKNLIRSIEKSPIKKVVFISSTSIFPSNNSVVDEQTETLVTVLAQIENLFRNNKHFETTIVRFAGLFGYDRKPGNFVKNTKLIKNPQGFVNMIHQDDCIGILEKIIHLNIWGETFNACTDSHPTRREYYTQESLKLSYTVPKFDEKSKNEYKIISNQKLKEALNYQFIHTELMMKL